jgi:hypothetical protein
MELDSQKNSLHTPDRETAFTNRMKSTTGRCYCIHKKKEESCPMVPRPTGQFPEGRLPIHVPLWLHQLRKGEEEWPIHSPEQKYSSGKLPARGWSIERTTGYTYLIVSMLQTGHWETHNTTRTTVLDTDSFSMFVAAIVSQNTTARPITIFPYATRFDHSYLSSKTTIERIVRRFMYMFVTIKCVH